MSEILVILTVLRGSAPELKPSVQIGHQLTLADRFAQLLGADCCGVIAADCRSTRFAQNESLKTCRFDENAAIIDVSFCFTVELLAQRDANAHIA